MAQIQQFDTILTQTGKQGEFVVDFRNLGLCNFNRICYHNGRIHNEIASILYCLLCCTELKRCHSNFFSKHTLEKNT